MSRGYGSAETSIGIPPDKTEGVGEIGSCLQEIKQFVLMPNTVWILVEIDPLDCHRVWRPSQTATALNGAGGGNFTFLSLPYSVCVISSKNSRAVEAV